MNRLAAIAQAVADADRLHDVHTRGPCDCGMCRVVAEMRAMLPLLVAWERADAGITTMAEAGFGVSVDFIKRRGATATALLAHLRFPVDAPAAVGRPVLPAGKWIRPDPARDPHRWVIPDPTGGRESVIALVNIDTNGEPGAYWWTTAGRYAIETSLDAAKAAAERCAVERARTILRVLDESTPRVDTQEVDRG